MVKVIAWYDNEWGYSCRIADLVALVAARTPVAPNIMSDAGIGTDRRHVTEMTDTPMAQVLIEVP